MCGLDSGYFPRTSGVIRSLRLTCYWTLVTLMLDVGGLYNYMNPHPGILLERVLLSAGPLTRSNCTTHVQDATEVLVNQLKGYARDKQILPSFPTPVEVLFTFDDQTSAWNNWEHVKVRMKVSAI